MEIFPRSIHIKPERCLRWLKRLGIRSYQLLLHGLALVLPFPQAQLLVGRGSVQTLAAEVRRRRWCRPLLVTDQTLIELGVAQHLFDHLTAIDVRCAVYNQVKENPSLSCVEQGLQHYRNEGCDSLIAVGGGSVIDVAKGIGARAGNPWLPLRWMEGLFRVLLPPPPLSCVPTTAGSGSDASIAAVLTDPANGRKLTIADFKLMPRLVAIDPMLMLALPPAVTAASGMDALTHAVESYIGRNATPFSENKALSALRRIAAWLPQAYRQGNHEQARLEMALAAHEAGEAFTRTNVGYAHAIAHALGCTYAIPHGLANAMALPEVLRWSQPCCEQRLASLARELGLGERNAADGELATRFIVWVENLNSQLGIPAAVASLHSDDIPAISRRILQEAHPSYPVPRLLNHADCEALLRRLQLRDTKYDLQTPRQ